MKEIVVNCCYGGFGLSKFAVERLGNDTYFFLEHREDKELIALLKEYGTEKIGGTFAELQIVEIPDNSTDYYIDEYDGMETVIYVVDGKIHFA